MTNPWRGEVALVLDGEPHRMRLTLGALAELEAQLESGSLVDLVQRFETGGFTTRDVLALIVAGLRGGGWQGTAKDLLSAEIEGGPLTAAKAAAELIARAFMLPEVTDGAGV
ncbi:gene transfer agent family protein [Cognatishimia sp. F0-27]|uniref:gene transfer agent family protein n=1 Tax=Cognatishimia sp. F0-27 TaxID=2816855 RepID=UPI001D0C7C1F|nr:gene transfer agent family protein [Cognatishimia sp. F0-27]MCC1493418.1 gene transfer agent family protein [Cognatishimia sp. F0-27]